MNPVNITIPFIEENLTRYGIEWLNTDRTSRDFKLKIYGQPNRQIAVYDRVKTIIRLEKYATEIEGVTVLPKCAKSDAANRSFSNFKNQKGICVQVDTKIALEKLLDWYYGIDS